MDFTDIFDRAKRAAMLDADVFKELAADTNATGSAFVVAILSSLVGGIGTTLFAADGTVGSWLSAAIIGAPLGLVIIAAITLGLGKLFGGTGDYGQLLRSLGFATGPSALGIIPYVGGLVGFVWTIVAAIVGVREVHAISTGAAAAVVLIPVAVIFIAAFLLLVFVLAVFAGLGG